MPHPNLVHWDDVPEMVIDRGPLQGRRRRLGAAAGAVGIGLSRYELGPGQRAMPVHVHADEEEHFHVLAGSGFSWQDGKAYAVHAGDTIVHRAQAEAHTIVAGDDGLDVLAFGTGSSTGMTWLPRAQTWWMGPHWIPHDGPNPFAAEAAAGPLDLPAPEAGRPPSIVALADAERGATDRDGYREEFRGLAGSAGSILAGLNHGVLEAGQIPCPPHWHSMEEECFVILEGGGQVWLNDERHDVRPGHVLVCPPVGPAHTLCAGEAGMTYLVFGTRAVGDYCYYPRSKKLNFGNGVIFHVEEADYFDGE
ncbi:MAG: cupin domain-containing protein [Solirubrobacteraceae bacterium]